MNKTVKLVLMVVLGLILLAAAMLGGGKLIEKMNANHQESMSSLENFGSSMLPGREGDATGGDGEHSALQPSITETKLSTSDKIIISLSKEKDLLAKELTSANIKIQALEERIELLQSQAYNSGLSRGVDDDRLYAMHSIQSLLDESIDAKRFNPFQRKVMSLSSAEVYHDILQRMGLTISNIQKNTLIMEHLPVYAFCIGDHIPLVVNNSGERDDIIYYLENHRTTPLPPAIQKDFETIQAPCLEQLNTRINESL